MRNHIEAATRCGMPAVGSFRSAIAAVSAYKTRMGAVVFTPLAVDANAAQGAFSAWSPSV
jgi:hypothetical protein